MSEASIKRHQLFGKDHMKEIVPYSPLLTPRKIGNLYDTTITARKDIKRPAALKPGEETPWRSKPLRVEELLARLKR